MVVLAVLLTNPAIGGLSAQQQHLPDLLQAQE
jgi:hypothetical protein